MQYTSIYISEFLEQATGVPGNWLPQVIYRSWHRIQVKVKKIEQLSRTLMRPSTEQTLPCRSRAQSSSITEALARIHSGTTDYHLTPTETPDGNLRRHLTRIHTLTEYTLILGTSRFRGLRYRVRSVRICRMHRPVVCLLFGRTGTHRPAALMTPGALVNFFIKTHLKSPVIWQSRVLHLLRASMGVIKKTN